jgi:hypothetical protein
VENVLLSLYAVTLRMQRRRRMRDGEDEDDSGSESERSSTRLDSHGQNRKGNRGRLEGGYNERDKEKLMTVILYCTTSCSQ